MNRPKLIWKIEKTIPWGVVGFFLGIGSGFLSAYSLYFTSDDPELKIKIISISKVFDVNQSVEELEVLVRGKKIDQTKETLSMLTLRIENVGNEGIRLSDFDPKFPLAIELIQGQILRCELIDCSSERFNEQLKDLRISTQEIEFPKFIMDVGEYVTINFVILHSINESIKINPKGKIAGVSKLHIEKIEGLTNIESNEFILSGSFYIQIIRILVYGGIVLISAGLSVLITFFIYNKTKNKILNSKYLRNDEKLFKIIRMGVWESRDYELLKSAGEKLLKNYPKDMQRKLIPVFWGVLDGGGGFNIHHFMELLNDNYCRKHGHLEGKDMLYDMFINQKGYYEKDELKYMQSREEFIEDKELHDEIRSFVKNMLRDYLLESGLFKSKFEAERYLRKEGDLYGMREFS